MLYSKLCFGAFICAAGLSVNAQTLKARIKIDAERVTGTIDPLLYGNFTEHLGRCIYGGLYEPTSKQANKDGFRKDVIGATRDMGVTIVRWPGGNFASGYHWLDGVGPVRNRPRRKDLAWGGVETNIVGTDEFMKFADASGVAPYICVNMGSGSAEEAKNWVEYCNGPAGFFYSDMRVANGHAAPYNVKYWGLGNEMDGVWQIGHLNAEDYCKKAMEAAKVMKWADTSIRLIASGSSAYDADWQHWNRMVLNEMFDHIDYISLHRYLGNGDNNHYRFMASLQRVDDVIDITRGMIKEAQQQHNSKKNIYIAFDEYNVWYRTGVNEKMEERYNLQDALMVAGYLNSFVRNADIVKMANLAQLVNVIAPLMVTDDKVWKQTTFYPLELFARNCRGEALHSFVESDEFDAGDFKHVPYLDVSTVYDPVKKQLIINAVNRSMDTAVVASIENQFGKLGPAGKVYEVNGQSLTDQNSVNEQKVNAAEKSLAVSGNRLEYRFPAHSFTQIIVPLEMP